MITRLTTSMSVCFLVTREYLNLTHLNAFLGTQSFGQEGALHFLHIKTH